MRFKSVIISFVLLTMALNIQAQQSSIVDGIIAKVGGEILLYSEWQEQIAYIKEKQAFLTDEDKCGILQNMLVQKFLIHQAKVDSLEVKDEEVDVQLNARIDQILNYMNNDFNKFEEYYGQPVSKVKERFREDIKNQLYTERMQGKITGNINLTPKEVEQFFKLIPKDSLPYLNAEVEIAELVVYPKINSDQEKNAKEKLEKILAKIKSGEDFSKLAKLHSDDPGSAKNGGELGWMKRGNLVPEFEATAYNLEKDSVSEIIETEYGFHIIKLIGRRGNSILTKHILIKPNFETSDYEKAEKYLDSLRSKIIKDTVVFEAAVREYSSKKAESYHNGGRILNPKTGTSYIEMGDLDPDVYFAIESMKSGEISKVISSTEPDGKKYFRLIKLLSRSSPHKANLKQDYSRIQLAAQEQKKNAIFQEWIAKNLPNVFVEIDPKMDALCPGIGDFKNANTLEN
ncbi:MAG TPA: peptidylprolyl isomerase [Saprospiraceae bacterium]|nr:peptidylprolyl isomerase [Saprospiraceae bacterium]